MPTMLTQRLSYLTLQFHLHAADAVRDILRACGGY
jgi:hypothetical protein